MVVVVGRSVQTFVPVLPRGLSHNDLEAYTFRRGGKTYAGIHKGDNLRRAEDELRAYLERSRPSYPLTGPIAEVVKLCFPIRGTRRKGEPMCDTPDADNMIKTINDLCEELGYIRNDRMVCKLTVYKVWSDPAGIFIRFEEMA